MIKVVEIIIGVKRSHLLTIFVMIVVNYGIVGFASATRSVNYCSFSFLFLKLELNTTNLLVSNKK